MEIKWLTHWYFMVALVRDRLLLQSDAEEIVALAQGSHNQTQN